MFLTMRVMSIGKKLCPTIALFDIFIDEVGTSMYRVTINPTR